MNRELAIAVVNNLPEKFALDIFLEQLVSADKIDKGIVQLNHGNCFTHQQVKEKIKEWQKS
jgi:predicted transcriptional regulator